MPGTVRIVTDANLDHPSISGKLGKQKSIAEDSFFNYKHPEFWIGEGNGNPLQYFCLENPMDRGAWEGTVHSVTKSWTRLKRLEHKHDGINEGFPAGLW